MYIQPFAMVGFGLLLTWFFIPALFTHAMQFCDAQMQYVCNKSMKIFQPLQ